MFILITNYIFNYLIKILLYLFCKFTTFKGVLNCKIVYSYPILNFAFASMDLFFT